MKKKMVALTLAAVTVMSSLGSVSVVSAGEAGEPIELEVMYDSNSVNLESGLIKEMEEVLNVKLNLVPAPTGSAEDIRKAINLQIASGDFPDMIANVKFPDYYTYAQQGLLAEVPVDMIKSEAPTITSWIEKNLYGEASWDYYAIDGVNYIVPSIWTIGPKFNTMVIRQDMLEKAGITELPDTLEQWEEAMLKVKEMNGSAPMMGPAGFKGIYDCVFGAYGVYPQIFTEKDGKVVYGAVEPEAKDALETLNRWYAEGIIDPEFVIDDEQKKREKWTAEKAAVTTGAFYHAITGEAYWGGQYVDPLMEKNPEAKVVSILPPAGPNGERGVGQDSSIVNAGVVFSREVGEEPEKLAKYLQLCDYMLKEQKKLSVGTEGETYKLDENGNVEWLPPYDNEDTRKEYGLGYSNVIGGFIDYDINFELLPAQFADVRAEAINNCVGKYDVLGPVPRPIYMEKKEALDRIVSKNIIDFITGDRDLAEFDAFVEEWNAAGGTEVMAEAQEYFEKLGLINVTWGEK